MPDACWGPVCEWVHLLSQWLKIHVLPVGPLLTPVVGTIAGGIAFYSIYVTRSVARKRAAVDFFLKTDMDKGMVDAHTSFQAAMEAWATHDKEGKPVETFVKGEDGKFTEQYRDITTYLNIHELVAMGIKNKVFDRKVCYNFWSDALVSHADKTRKIIEYDVSSEGGAASFLELRNLSEKWKKRNERWQKKQLPKAKRKGLRPEPVQSFPAPGQNSATPYPQTKDEHPQSPKVPDAPRQ